MKNSVNAVTFNSEKFNDLSILLREAQDNIYAKRLKRAVSFAEAWNTKQANRRFFRRKDVSIPQDGSKLDKWFNDNIQIVYNFDFKGSWSEIKALYIINDFLSIIVFSGPGVITPSGAIPDSYSFDCSDYAYILKIANNQSKK